MNRKIEGFFRRHNLELNWWFGLSLLIILLILIPNISILVNVFSPVNDNWIHLREHLLKDYIINTSFIIAFTGIFSAVLGVTLAWIITMYKFPFRKLFEWLLVLPLAIPPYIGAYVYSNMFSYTGNIQIFFRRVLELNLDQRFFNIMNIPGAVTIYTLFLYPYVYLIVKAFISKQSASMIESARSLGKSTRVIFFRLIIPLARPAIIGGTTLVLLETLNDYGVVTYFGISTFTTGIFRVWFSSGDIDSAVRLSATLMGMVLVLVLIEKFARGRRKYQYSNTKIRPIQRQEISGMKLFIVMAIIVFTLLVGFIVPVMQLIQWVSLTNWAGFNFILFELTTQTLIVSLIASFLTVIAAIIVANTARLQINGLTKIYSKIATMGYSIPGAVIALGVIIVFTWLQSKGVNLTTTIIMLVFAYVVRFLTIGYNAIETGFDKVGKSFYEASKSLGKSDLKTFFLVDLPMIKAAIIGGFLLVFIDILKELPLTMILRPFNFDTLATKSFEYANDEMVHEAAITSLAVIFLAVLAILCFYIISHKKKEKR